MNIPSSLKYAESNEWISADGKIGITDFAQSQLSDVVFFEAVVAIGDIIKKGDIIATVESVKAAADVYAPASGKVTAVNEDLPGTPETLNTDPYGAAWMIQLELSNPAELAALMDAATYEKVISDQ
jgi:glycine cleavage system H protein